VRRLSVVIPTYNRRSMLPRVIAPLLGDAATAEVIVVVDGAQDGSLELLAELSAEDRRVVPLATPNRGADSARTTGVERAESEIVLILDDDVEAGPQLAPRHLAHHAAGTNLAVVGYMPLVKLDTPTARSYARSYENRRRLWEQQPGSVIRTLWAGNISLRREPYLRAVSRPLRHRYNFHADRAFSYRCVEAGPDGVFAAECRAAHHYTRTVPQFARDAWKQGHDRVMLHDEFRAFEPSLPSDYFTRWASPWLKPLIEAGRRPRLASVTSATASAYASRGGHGPPAADRALDLFATIELQRGAIAAARELRAGYES